MRSLCIILSNALAEGGMWVGRDADAGRLHNRKNFELRNDTRLRKLKQTISSPRIMIILSL